MGIVWLKKAGGLFPDVPQQEYVECLRLFLNEKSGRVRLPKNELEKRISNPDDYLVR